MKRAKMKHKSGAYHGSSLDGERRQRAEEVQRGRGTVEAACEVAAEAARAHAAPAVAAAATGPGRPYAIHNTTVLIPTHLENKAAMCKRLTYRVYIHGMRRAWHRRRRRRCKSSFPIMSLFFVFFGLPICHILLENK